MAEGRQQGREGVCVFASCLLSARKELCVSLHPACYQLGKNCRQPTSITLVSKVTIALYMACYIYGWLNVTMDTKRELQYS